MSRKTLNIVLWVITIVIMGVAGYLAISPSIHGGRANPEATTCAEAPVHIGDRVDLPIGSRGNRIAGISMLRLPASIPAPIHAMGVYGSVAGWIITENDQSLSVRSRMPSRMIGLFRLLGFPETAELLARAGHSEFVPLPAAEYASLLHYSKMFEIDDCASTQYGKP